jgi:hypothetical protein
VVAVPVLAFPFPVRLTNTHWQKKKGLQAKNTKTGVGETLVALQKALLKVRSANLIPTSSPPKRSTPSRS